MSNNISNNTINYITKETKANKEFQNLLSIMSRADAQHDIDFLKKEFKENKSILNSFATALPSFPSESWDEEDCLKNIFLNQKYNNLRDILDNEVPDVTQTKINKTPKLFDIGFNTTKLHTFSCVKFVIQASSNKAKNLIPATGDIATNFCINTDFCGLSNNAILVIDVNQHGILSIFKEGVASSLFHLHYVVSPEVINDPGSKPSVHDAIFSPNSTKGIKMNSYVQAGADQSIYSNYDPNNIGFNNNFFSKYNFALDPIKSIYTKQKAEKLITNLNIYWNADGSKQPFTDNITDSKGENSNNSVKSYIINIIKNITSSNNNNLLNFNFNKNCQQKRGGDWFQALCCLDIKNREFTNIQNRTEGAKPFPSNYPVYFVTLDRIAVSYALLMGVNVLYVDYYGSVFVFKNQADESTKSSNKSYEEGLFDMLQTLYLSSNISGNSDLNKYLSFNINYNVARENILKKEYQDLTNYIVNANKEIESLDTSNIDTNANIKSKFISNFQTTIKNIFQHLFPLIVRYFFLTNNLIDTKEDVKYIDDNKSILESGKTYSNELKDQILKLYQAYNRVNGVYTIHGGGTKDLIEYSILLWSNNIQKLDVYRSAKNLLNIQSYQDKKTFDLRLLNYNTNVKTSNQEEKRINDIYIFLPYIQTIGNDVKKKIMDFMDGPLLGKSLEYRNYISTGKSIFRLNRLSPNEVFFNQIANFIYEARIFLEVNPDEIPLVNQVEKLVESAVDSVKELGQDLGQDLGIVNEKPTVESPTVEPSTDKLSLLEPINMFDSFQLSNKEIKPFISLSTDVIVIAEDFFEITYIRGMGNMKGIGKFSNSSSQIEEEEPSDPSYLFQLGGFSYYESKDITKKLNNDVTIDISIRQITWPLLTNLLITNGFNNINKKKIINYISDREKVENEWNDMNDLKKRISPLEKENIPNKINKRDNNLLLGGSLNNNFDNNELILLLENINKLGKDKIEINFGYHPLVPIYMILSSMWYFVTPDLNNDCFYDTFLDYFFSLEKMTNVLINDYLQQNVWSQAYFIGFALKIFFFESYTSEKSVQELTDLLNVQASKYRMYSLKNDLFGNNIVGYILPDTINEQNNNTLLFSDLFKNFLIKEVQLSTFIENSTNWENLPSIDEFQEKIYVLMKKIVDQIEKDRNQDQELIEESNESYTSSNISSNDRNKIIDTKKRIDEFGNIINIPIISPKRGIYTLKDYPQSSNSSNNNSLVYNSSSTNSYGGFKKTKKNKKSKKNRKKNKRIIKTIKNKKIKKKSKFLTKKMKQNNRKKKNKTIKLVKQ